MINSALIAAFVLLNNCLINGHERDARGPVFFPRVERRQGFVVYAVDEVGIIDRFIENNRKIGNLPNEVNAKLIWK